MCGHVRACVCVCVCVRACERERECVHGVHVCVCVRACETERERERECGTRGPPKTPPTTTKTPLPGRGATLGWAHHQQKPASHPPIHPQLITPPISAPLPHSRSYAQALKGPANTLEMSEIRQLLNYISAQLTA